MGFLSLCLLSLSRGAPQYSGEQTGSLDAGSLDTIAEIFGTSGKQVDGGYGSGQRTGALSDDVDVLVQVIQESNNEYPNDYVPESAQQVVDKATVEVNTDFENCADYTESLGYECVPYYQCHNGTPGVYASVSKALCWIDYAMSCHYGASTGDYNSYNGYTSNVCQEWMD